MAASNNCFSIGKIVRIIGLCFLLLFWNILWVTQSPADDTLRIEKLEREVQELKGIVNQLVEENKSLKVFQTQASESSLGPVTVLSDSKTASPILNIHGFGDLGYTLSNVDRNDGSESATNNFLLGDFDLFLTSKIGDKINFLNETVFEFKDDATTAFDVERLLLKYELADWLNIAIGRGHTAVAYWNINYHHGRWLYTTVDKPLSQRWEDEGGILPSHYTGVEASGILNLPPGDLSYIFELGNGRGTTPDDVRVIDDKNDSKMTNIYFTYEPAAIEGLGVGGSFLHDIIPANPGTVGRENQIDEGIYGAHVIYVLAPYEFIAETNIVDHFNHDNNSRDVTTGGYVQIAYAIDKYKPYLRYDWLWMDDADLFFAGAVQDEVSYTSGIRYDLSAYNALKLEYRYVDKDTEKRNEFTLQSSFAF